ncbi:MAG: diphthine--ammonia ligase [Bacteroidota bacterium]
MLKDSRIPVVLCWSGGKDSALSLHRIQRSGRYVVRYLLTTVHRDFERISMHGVRESLLNQQAESIGIPLVKAYVSEGTYEEYDRVMEAAFQRFKEEGIDIIAYGDINLEDLRAYRDRNLEKIGMEGLYPLWKENTRVILQEFLDAGFKTVTCCVNDAWFDESAVGREIDLNFVRELPANVDPCGENGEFHTFCYAGPMFKRPLSLALGEKTYRPLNAPPIDDPEELASTKGFWYCDLELRNEY